MSRFVSNRHNSQYRTQKITPAHILLVHLYSIACYTDGYLYIRKNGIRAYLLRGQALISLRGTGRHLKFSYSTIRRALDELEKAGVLVQQKSKNGTLVTLMEYEKNRPRAKNETPPKIAPVETPRKQGPEACTKNKHETLKEVNIKTKTLNARVCANTEKNTDVQPPDDDKKPRRWKMDDVCRELYGIKPDNPRLGIHPLTPDQHNAAFEEMEKRNKQYDQWEWRQQNRPKSEPNRTEPLPEAPKFDFARALHEAGFKMTDQDRVKLNKRRQVTLLSGGVRNGVHTAYAADSQWRVTRSVIEIRKIIQMGYSWREILNLWQWGGWIAFRASQFLTFLTQAA